MARDGFQKPKLKSSFADRVLCQELSRYKQILCFSKLHIAHFLAFQALELLEYRFFRRLKLERVRKGQCQLIQAGRLSGNHFGANLNGKSGFHQSLKKS